MSRLQLRVVKVGGSLLDLPDLADRVRGFLHSDDGTCNILIAGGGPFVEQVRHIHKLTPLDETTAHWMCIDLMSITARLLAEQLAISPVINSIESLPSRTISTVAVFDVANWLRESEPSTAGGQLPASWDITSDSIAARVATVLDSDELVLMKSAIPKNGAGSLSELADARLVDPMFPKFAANLPSIRIVNLRDSGSLLVRGAKNQAEHGNA